MSHFSPMTAGPCWCHLRFSLIYVAYLASLAPLPRRQRFCRPEQLQDPGQRKEPSASRLLLRQEAGLLYQERGQVVALPKQQRSLQHMHPIWRRLPERAGELQCVFRGFSSCVAKGWPATLRISCSLAISLSRFHLAVSWCWLRVVPGSHFSRTSCLPTAHLTWPIERSQLQHIIDTEALDGCSKLCNGVFKEPVPTKTCNVICDAVGIKNFVKSIEK